jgi:hypothetical protein
MIGGFSLGFPGLNGVEAWGRLRNFPRFLVDDSFRNNDRSYYDDNFRHDDS